MGFGKAWQKNKPEGYEKYVEEMILYKKACTEFQRTGRKLQKKLVRTAAEKLALYEASEKYSEACRRFQRARMEYTDAALRHRLKEKGIEIGAGTLAELLDIAIPTTMKEMIEQAKKDSIAASMSPEEFERLRQAALAYLEKKNEAQAIEEGKFSLHADVKKGMKENSPIRAVKPADTTELVDLDALGDKPAAME